MENIYFIALLTLLPSIFAVNQDQLGSFEDDFDSTVSDLNDDSRLQSLDLSPFGAELYRYVSTSDIFDKLFVETLTPSEAALGFYNAAMLFAQIFGVPNPHPLPLQLSLVARDVFAKQIPPMDYFNAFSNTIEDYLEIIGLLTPDNIPHLAYSFFKNLNDMLIDNNTDITHPLSILYALTMGCFNFLKTFGDMPHDTVLYMISKFTNELIKIRDSRDEQ